MVLIMARQGGWTAGRLDRREAGPQGGWTAGRLDRSEAVAKALKTKLNFKGGH